MKLRQMALICAMVLAATGLASCGATATPAQTEATTTYDDPFAYCAAVGTMDTPDTTYTGPQVPESVAQALQTALNAPDTPLDIIENGMSWRCMDSNVYACFVGANLPCDAKAQTDKTPTQEEIDYCNQNPDSDIPAVVTGRETVYVWRCTDGVPEIAQEVYHPDAQGYIAEIWYNISTD